MQHNVEPWKPPELARAHLDTLTRLRDAGKTPTEICRTITDITGRFCRRSTVRSILRTIDAGELDRYGMRDPQPVREQLPPLTEPLDVSPIPDAEEPLQELLARRMQETRRKIKREAERIKVCKMPAEPFALAIFGDPHLDDPGCRYDLLMRDIKAAARPGVYSISVGDHQNHWIGRLAKKYANQGTTASEGWRLAQWFLGAGAESAGLNFLIAVGGNHDAWAHSLGWDPYATLCRDSVRYYDDAEVRLRLAFDDQCEPITLLVRHDFPGRSWFHSSHGPAKAALLDHEADVLCAGHLHSWACLQQEVAGGRSPVAIRVRGYKHGDHYARERGFLEQQHGQACMVVIDPHMYGPGKMSVHWDLGAGAAYLEQLRSMRKS